MFKYYKIFNAGLILVGLGFYDARRYAVLFQPENENIGIIN